MNSCVAFLELFFSMYDEWVYTGHEELDVCFCFILQAKTVTSVSTAAAAISLTQTFQVKGSAQSKLYKCLPKK